MTGASRLPRSTLRRASWAGVLAASATTGAVCLLAVWAWGGANWARLPAGGLASPGWGLVWVLAAVALIAVAWLDAVPAPGRAVLTTGVAWAWLGPLLAVVPSMPSWFRWAALAAGAALPLLTTLLVVVPFPRTPRAHRLLLSALATAVAATALRALAYDPLRDPTCTRLCLPGAGWWSDVAAQPPVRLAVAGLVTASVALVVAAAFMASAGRRSRGGIVLLVGVLAVLPWWTTGVAAPPRADDLAALGVAVAAITALARLAVTERRRREAYRLLHDVEHGVGSDAGSLAPESSTPPALRLALVNARLTAEAAEQAAQIRRSRSRIVAASDDERRRLGRELHDLVQQRVVGALLQCRIASADEQDAVRRGRLLAAVDELGAVLPHLRGLTERTAPALVDSDGLSVAVEQRAAALVGLRVEVEGMKSEPPARVARQAYIVIDSLLDAVTRPYAGATLGLGLARDAIRIRLSAPRVVLPELLADRVAAAGGTVERSTDDETTETLEVVLPCGP